MEQKFPSGKKRAEVKGEDQFVCLGLCADRILGHQIGVKCLHVGVGDGGKMVIGKGRIKVLALPIYPVAHRPVKGRKRPGSDAGVPVRGDVGRIDRTKGCLQRQPPRCIMVAFCCMAGGTIADHGKVCALGDQVLCQRHRIDLVDGGNFAGKDIRHIAAGDDQSCNTRPRCDLPRVHGRTPILLNCRLLSSDLMIYRLTPGVSTNSPVPRTARNISSAKNASDP